MAIKEYVGEDATTHVNNEEGNDFKATVYDTEDVESLTSNNDTTQIERKRKIKSDIFTVAAAAVINASPIVIESIKHRKDSVPYKQTKSDIVRFGMSLIMPTIQLLDTVLLNGKIQNTIKEKTPFKFSDINNVVNLVAAYPSTHTVVQNFFSNVSRQQNGQQQVAIDDTSKRDAFVACATLVSPYVMEKMADERYTFVEKVSNVLPIKIFGGLVRRVASTNPTLQNGYNMVTTCLQVADFGNKKFNTAVRSNNGMRTNPSNTFSTILDVAQDAMGMSRGNISYYNNGGYDGWNNGSRFNNF